MSKVPSSRVSKQDRLKAGLVEFSVKSTDGRKDDITSDYKLHLQFSISIYPLHPDFKRSVLSN